MLTHLIDICLYFTISFLTFFGLYKLMVRSEQQEDMETIINKRVIVLSKQQDELLESANEHVSTFVKVQHEDFGEGEGSGDTFNDRIIRIMKGAGITEMTVNEFLLFCTIGGVIFAILIVHFEFLSTLAGIPVGFCVGAFLVYQLLAAQAEQKKMEFLQQLPDAIDMMIRGVKAGLNINRVIKLVSLEARDPLAAEYLTISQKFDLGVEPEKVLTEAADRVDIEEFRFLVVALVLQLENGGVLSEILANLSGIVRKRLELGLKVKALSAEARMSAVVLSALPFAFSGIMFVLNPGHMQEFMKPGMGQTMLKIMITLFALGTFFMIKATKIKV